MPPETEIKNANKDEYNTLPETEIKKNLKKHIGKKGLLIKNYFVKDAKDAFETVEYEKRISRIVDADGATVFEMKDVEVPKEWSQVATDILAQKYFRKKDVPQYDENGKIKRDKDGNEITGAENSVKQVVNRMAGTWRHWGEHFGYFETKKDTDVFENELKYMLLHQMAAPNSPQWFNTGLYFAYGITGEAQGHYYIDANDGKAKKSKDAYSRPQPHACFIQSIKDDMVNKGGIFDLALREALLFKYGSGTGTNFSNLRGNCEPLSGGGKSSGLMSFLQVFDRAAGSIKSGGTTRRAAKMVSLNMDHPEIEDFINWKVREEQKVAALITGSNICYKHLKKIMKNASENGIDSKKNPELKKLIAQANQNNVPLNYVKRILMLVEQGRKPENFNFETFDSDFRSEAYATVGGQNSNNSIRMTKEFIDAVTKDGSWDLIRRSDGSVYKTVQARDLWELIAYAVWNCADPGIQFDTTINEWHTCPESGRINASNPCSEYMFLDDTACNLASINLIKFFDAEKQEFDTEGFQHACRIWTIVLEISILMAQFPSKDIARLSYEFRTLGLGYANLGTLLMQHGIPYDSEEGRAICGAISSIMCGEAYSTSAEMAKILHPFPQFEQNRNHMLRVIRNHRRAAYNRNKDEYEDLSITPKGIDEAICPKPLLEAARTCWDTALRLGEAYGYRNAQATVIAPTGTIGLLMDCDTTGIEPDFALVKFKKLVGGGYFKIINQALQPALKKLGYSKEQIEEIIQYCKGSGTLTGCAHINAKSLREKGFTDKELAAVEAQCPSIFELKFAFNKWALGEKFCKEALKFDDAELNSHDFDMLKALGYSEDQIAAANEYVCGTMRIESAPHLQDDHYAVFDCANKCGKKGQRYIHQRGHIYMMAAAQPFISGAISKTINLPQNSSINEIEEIHMESWRSMLKAIALYRDGSKLSQPLTTASSDDLYADLFDILGDEYTDETMGPKEVQQVIEKIVQKPMRRKLPAERNSVTHKFSIAGHEGYITVGLYADGTPGEIFIKISKEGSTLSGIMDALALSTSLNLQYGVPLEVLVNKFTHTRFEPAGMTKNQEIPMVKSIIDYLGRWLALRFLDKERAKKYHNNELVEKFYRNRLETSSITEEVEEITKKVFLDNAKAVEEEEETGVSRAMSTISASESLTLEDHYAKSEFTESSIQKMQAKYAVSLNNEDAPMCHACGSVMVRNGACYKCLDCGETSGCS